MWRESGGLIVAQYPRDDHKRTLEEARAEAARQAKIRALPQFTRILLDWDDNVVRITLTTGREIVGALHVNFDFTIAFIELDDGRETAYRIENIIGVEYVGEEYPK
jgi:hypothetical protein